MKILKRVPGNRLLHGVVGTSVALTALVMIGGTVVLQHSDQPGSGRVLGEGTAPTASPVANTTEYSLSVHGVIVGAVDAGAMTKRVSVAVHLANIAQETLQISPGLSMFLRTNDGKQYPMTAKYLEPGVVIGGPLVAGSATDLTIDFDVPVNSMASDFVYQTDAGALPSVVGL